MLIKVKGGRVWKVVCDEIDLYGWLIKGTEVVLAIFEGDTGEESVH